MLLLSCTEDGNVNPNLDRPRIKFRLLASTAVLYRPDLIQAPQRRKEGKELKEKKNKHGAGKKPFLTGCGMSAFAPISLNGLPVVSYWCP